MKILIIANNIIGDSDGIGKHARLVKEEFSKREGVEAVIVSRTTTGFSTIKKFFSLEMHKAFKQAYNYISQEKPNVVIVEYPFDEFNPIILLDYRKLHKQCKKNGARLALSLHEYDRVKYLRRKVIESFMKNSDLVFVSEPHYLETLKPFNKNIYLRTIPNHIVSKSNNIEKDRRRFVYYGIVNKAKAFEELIKAWRIVNKERNYVLDIVTISDISVNDSNRYNINLHIGTSDSQVEEILSEVACAVLPIKPSISFNNGTFVSCAQNGCMIIGIASDDIKNERFIIQPNEYTPESLAEAIHKVALMNDDELKSMQTEARKFGSKFSVESTVSQMLERFEK